MDRNGIQAKLNKGKYFNYGEKYYVTFKYNSEEQKRKVKGIFDDELIPVCGANSFRAKEGKEYIMPYYNQYIRSTSIPEYLLSEMIRRFVELDGMNVTIGENSISEKFDENTFKSMITELEQNAEKIDYNGQDEEPSRDEEELAQGFTEKERADLDELNVDRENDDKMFTRAKDFTPDELEQMSNEDLEGMLKATEDENALKRGILENARKKELISKIKIAVAEGEELDSKIKMARENTKER